MCVTLVKNQEAFKFSHYVITDHHPSDLTTRGLSVQDIMCSLLWWHGASWWHGSSWLPDDDTLWTAWNFSDVSPEVLQQIEDEARK